jgi:hypothetical protein
VPPLAELCLDPFEGTLAGASVMLGSPDVAEAFLPLATGDEIPLVVGAQGGAMTIFRLAIAGVETPPECIGARITVTADGVAAPVQEVRIALHCGVSLPVYAILPTEYCEPATIPVELQVEIEGVGTGTASVQFTTEGKCVG